MSKDRTLQQSQKFYRQFFSTTHSLSPDNRERYEVIFGMIDSLSLPASSRALDIGAGSGRISRFLLERFENVVSVDITPTVLMKSTLHDHRPLRFAIAALPELPFPNDSFGLVICSEVLEHIEADVQPLSLMELGRVVAYEGWLILSTPNPQSFFEIVRRPGALIKRGAAIRKGQLMENYMPPGLLRGLLEGEFIVAGVLGSFYLFPPLNRLAIRIPLLYSISEGIRSRGWFATRGLYQYYVLKRQRD